MAPRSSPREYRVAVPHGFRLRSTVLSHGWVFLPPFAWDGVNLELRVSHGRSRAQVRVAAASPQELVLHASGPHTGTGVTAAVRWALRLDEDFTALRERAAHDPLVKKALGLGWGRLLRAPTVWEEAVRVLCTTNIQWGGTVAMMRGLVQLGGGYFPTPADVARFGEQRLKTEARMGYRAASLIALARDVNHGFDLEAWKVAPPGADELESTIRSWHGFGPYATAHLLVQLGHYGRLPIDSEVRAFHVTKSGRQLSDARIKALYAPYGEYAFLAYKLRRIALRRNWIGAEVSGASKG
jgi:N-glycosylase/DNA lyase